MLSFEAVLTDPLLISERSLKHRLFFPIPTLQHIPLCLDTDIMLPFLSYAQTLGITFNWSLHLHLLDWCMERPCLQPLLSTKTKVEMVQAALMRWSMSGFEHYEAKGILIIPKHLPDSAFGLWKSKKVESPHRLVRCRLQSRHLREDCFVLSHTYDQWPTQGFQSIPL